MMVRPQFRINSQINAEEAELQLPQMKCQTLLHKVDKVDEIENHELVFAQLQGSRRVMRVSLVDFVQP